MNPIEQCIAIAEACGAAWIFTHRPSESGDVLTCQKVLTFQNDYHRMMNESMMTGAIIGRDIPQYLTDLNVMYGVEKILNEQQQATYALFLHQNSKRNQSDYLGRDFDVLHANAVQRAEAFLRTIGKWEDGK